MKSRKNVFGTCSEDVRLSKKAREHKRIKNKIRISIVGDKAFYKTTAFPKTKYCTQNTLKHRVSRCFPLVLFKPHLSTYHRTTSGSVRTISYPFGQSHSVSIGLSTRWAIFRMEDCRIFYLNRISSYNFGTTLFS